MKSIIYSLAILLLFASVCTTILAQPRQKFHKKYYKERIIEKLNLTDDQENKISGLRTKHQKKMADLKAELEKAKIDIRDLRDNSDLTRTEMILAVESINTIKNTMALERANHKIDVYELLTNEQKQIWKEHEPFGNRMGLGFGNKGFGNRFNGCRLGPPDLD